MADFFAAVEEAEFDEEGGFEDFRAHFLQEHRRGFGGAPGGQEVVNEQDARAGFHGVGVDGDGGFAVFEGVALFVGVEGELAFLAHGHEAGVELDRGGGSEDEPAGVNADNGVHVAALEAGGEQINGAAEQAGVGQDGGDVLELDAGFGEVRDVADGVAEVLDGGKAHGEFTIYDL